MAQKLNPIYISGLVNAIDSVFQSVSSHPAQCQEPALVEQPEPPRDIAVLIGFVGDMAGQVEMSMDDTMGRQLASELLGGMEIAEVDELVVSAVGELGNMIMGSVCTQMSRTQIALDITPPMVLLGACRLGEKLSPPFYRIPVELKNLGTIAFSVLVQAV